MKTAIIIPARYGSTRFPGKPLALIGGRSMLSYVVDVAREASDQADILVATEDERIAAHCEEIGAECLMTPADCASGSDRALAAVQASGRIYDYVVNLQGDAPFTPAAVVRQIIEAFADGPEVVTPVVRLSWDALNNLRENKKTTPFSGTTAIIDESGQALWFSKNIIPAIRKEDRSTPLSPVYQHIGLYGYRADILGNFCSWPQGCYEQLEGLEQLRLLENGVEIQTVEADYPEGILQSGIDTPEDLARAESILINHQDTKAPRK